MTDIKYLKGIQAGATKDGSGIIVAGATESEGIFTIALPAEELGALVCDLLRIGARPEVAGHATAKQSMHAGQFREVRPFRVEAVSVGTIPVLPAAVLLLDFPAIDRISVALSLDESDQLVQQLQEAAQKLRAIDAQKPH